MHTKSRTIKNKKKSAADFMPQDEQAKHILLERAHQFAKETSNEESDELLTKYIRFRLGSNEFYGIPYEKIKEVMHNIPLTRIPNAPSFVAGVINRGGTLIAVIDLQRFFHMPSIEDKSTNIIIVTDEHATVGILVNNIEGSSTYNSSLLDAPILSLKIAAEFIIGIHQSNTTIIDINAILANLNLHLNAKPRRK